VRRLIFLASLVFLLTIAFFASYTTAAAQDAAPTEPMTATETVTVTEGVTALEPAEVAVPFLDEWMGSAHANAASEAFRHWDEEDPAEIPTDCAKCHSSTGYQDYLGADGSTPNAVDAAVAPGTVVDCVACHNSVTVAKTSAIMPSGIELVGLGDESRCVECHQGRESKVSVDAAIAEAGVDVDATSEDLGFRNIHYYTAAVTKYGTLAKGGYEYDGKSYDAMFAHVEGYETCNDCHNPHTLELPVEECATCHEGVAAVEDLRNIRMAGSEVDYDGDGDEEEGIFYELEGLQQALYANIQAYAAEVAGTALVYDPATYPYFFVDTDGDGAVTEGETEFANGFAAWTPRLLKAAYNYQASIKDPGAYAHGGKYIIQLLYDSIEDLNAAVAAPIDLAAANRIDAGHFAGSEEAFRHWDAEGEVPGNCAKCHSAVGLPTFLANGVNIAVEPANGFQCTTCHNDLQEYTRYEVASVKFPSGAEVDSGNQDTNLCMNCHQGRESGVSIARAIGSAEDDAVTESLRFLNPHYFAAGATRFGADVNGAYQYEGKEYAGYFEHDDDMAQCSDCHKTHGLEVNWQDCADCHDNVEGPEGVLNIRESDTDFDGDGDATEGVALEIQTMLEALYPAIQAYASGTAGTGLIYDAHSHPYFFIDTNGNGEVDEDEVNGDNRYATWTPRLLRAAYNYQYVQKDPGAFAHNPAYIIQVLYDSIEDVGGDVSAMTRP
jgi:hypothetical protein